jgi:hypothetical protein
MPADLPDRRRRLADSGADVAKVVGTARSLLDNSPIFQALAEASGPTVAIAMGGPGLATRVLCLRHASCLLTFAAPDDEAGTAPGQVPLRSLLTTYRARSIGPATVAYGVVSLSQADGAPDEATIARLNDLARERGRDAVWVPLVARDLGEVADVLGAFGGAGFGGFALSPSARGALGAGAEAGTGWTGVRQVGGTSWQVWGQSVEEVGSRMMEGSA